MATSYLFTLFLLIILQVHLVSLRVWESVNIKNLSEIYQTVFAIILFVLLYGLTHTVKANANAKNHSYVCALICAIYALVILGFMLFIEQLEWPTMALSVLCFLSAVNLAKVTYKKTKSYFL